MSVFPDTTICISIAERPGNFGKIIFNASFKALGLDFIYQPLKVTKLELPKIIDKIRKENIRGCGVSMPHKIAAMQYLDKIDDTAKKIGAINTIVNNRGVLSGYNTDFKGAQRALKEYYDVAGKKVLIIGAGGVARAIIMALKEGRASKIYITNRDENSGKRVAKEFNLEYYSYHRKTDLKVDLLVNATSVGMSPLEKEMIIDEKFLTNYQAIMDVIINPSETLLMSKAKKLGKVVIPGYKMALYQAAAQFELYTGKEAPLQVMADNIRAFFNNEK